MTLIPTFGFSFVGLAFLLALFIPNILWWRFGIPQGYSTEGESRVLGVIERMGQVLVTGTALAFDNTNLHPWTPWSWWLVGAVALMVAYEAAWVRYFLSARTMHDFYRPLLGLPVPLAVLPCAAFLLLGVYGMLWPLVVASLVLAVGHVGIHVQHWRALRAG